jgi:uncharacterized protein GlcG (DUF336 family)
MAAGVAACQANGYAVAVTVVDRAGTVGAVQRAESAGPHTLGGMREMRKAGGVPVKVDNEVIGAVGIGGAPGGHLDEQCAIAAIDKVKELLK